MHLIVKLCAEELLSLRFLLAGLWLGDWGFGRFGEKLLGEDKAQIGR